MDPEAGLLLFPGDQIGVLPHRNTILPRDAIERPARQRLPGIPLALPEVQQAAGRRSFAQAADQDQTAGSLDRSQRIEVPLRALGLVDSYERGLAAHGQAHILCPQVAIYGMSDLP